MTTNLRTAFLLPPPKLGAMGALGANSTKLGVSKEKLAPQRPPWPPNSALFPIFGQCTVFTEAFMPISHLSRRLQLSTFDAV